MALKRSEGNMYDWVTHTHTHLGGECPHQCSYCYVGRSRWGRAERYKGEPRIIEKELEVNYSVANTIFIEHMSDMFAEGIKEEWIRDILAHCNRYKNNYVFQTKNPKRAYEFRDCFPKKFLIGTTIETNRIIPESKAPKPIDRCLGIMKFKQMADIFVTIEPVMDFDVGRLAGWLHYICPLFVNIGADSKSSGLTEPPPNKIRGLIKALQDKNITIKKKTNLQRLLSRGPTNAM